MSVTQTLPEIATLKALAVLIADIILYRLTPDIQCHTFSG
jgi:hypothetical protein